MVHDIKEKVILVTGAAGGIGEGIVRAFLQEDAKHVAILDVAETAGRALEVELNSKHGAGKAKFFKCDVTDDDQLFNAFSATVTEQGCIHLVVNNAGIMNDSFYKKCVAINLTAVVTGTLKAIELMRKDKAGEGGTVINVSSIAGLHQIPHMPVYFATKSAVLQFSNCIGMEENYQRTGVRVVTVAFGLTDTAIIHRDNLGTVYCDDADLDDFLVAAGTYYKQKVESAVRGVVDAYKYGVTGSTWLADHDRPPVEITQDVKDGFNLMSTRMRE